MCRCHSFRDGLIPLLTGLPKFLLARLIRRTCMVFTVFSTPSSFVSPSLFQAIFPLLHSFLLYLSFVAVKLTWQTCPLACREPAKFCQFLYQRCKELGVRFSLSSNVTSVSIDNDSSTHFTTATVESLDSTKSRNISVSTIVIAAGPWSPPVFSTLFPNTTTKIPMNPVVRSQNHVLLKMPERGGGSSDRHKASEQVILSNLVEGGHGFEACSFTNGSLWIGGYDDVTDEVPESADSVKPRPAAIKAIVQLARRFTGHDFDEERDVVAGRCYLPQATPDHPIIANVGWDRLVSGGDAARASDNRGRTEPCSVLKAGLFVNTAHNDDGVTLSLGSGKVMSELLLGVEPSVDISGLGLA